MSPLEINKIIGAVLVAGLIFMVINVAVDEVLREEAPETLSYPVPGADTEAAVADTEPAVAEPEAAADAEPETQAAEPASPPTEAAATAESEPAAEAEAPAAKPAAPAAEQVAAAEATAAPSLAAMLADADVDNGKKVARACIACHDMNQGGPNKVGPNLWGIVGADKAGHANFRYSRALAELGGTWDYDDLDAFLARPKDFARGTKMAYAGVKDEADRADLIAYLRTLSEDPPPLPAAP